MPKKASLIPEQQLKKHALLFCLDNVLIPGAIAENINRKAINEILSNLYEMENHYKNFHIYVASGADLEKTRNALVTNNLDKYFISESVFGITQEYIDSKEQIDKERYNAELAKNPEFKDEFFKQYVIESELINKRGILREDILLICHDLLTDAFYTLRFSQVDFALVKDALSYREVKLKEIIKDLVYIRMDWNDIKKLLLGKARKGSTKFLESFIYSKLNADLLGGFGIDVKTIELKKKEKMKKKMQQSASDSAKKSSGETSGDVDF